MNAWKVVAPSTYDASISSLGIPSIYPFINHMLYALPAHCINIRTKKLSIPFILYATASIAGKAIVAGNI